MKRKILFFAMMLAITGLVALQSCKKEEGTKVEEFYAFTEPAVTAPADAETVHITGTTVDLTWVSTSESGFPVKADVYFGTDPEPPLYKANHNALTLNVPVEQGVTYYWHVVMKDGNGITTEGPTWSFTIYEPIVPFLGDYIADEPAEAYSYPVVFTKETSTSLAIDAYWNSWPAIFTLDFTNNTYSMPLTDFGGGYSGIESGTIDPETGTIVGDYIIYQNDVNIEEGVHTYTKQ
jgi:hypothetical protein